MTCWGWESSQLQNFDEIEKRLWFDAGTLGADSSLPSTEYFLPKMGLIFSSVRIQPTLKCWGGDVP
jgi:hypothetical protein